MNSITYQSSPGQSVKFATVSSDIRILANVTHTKGPIFLGTQQQRDIGQ